LLDSPQKGSSNTIIARLSEIYKKIFLKKDLIF
jgi:hypothetical protein